MRSTVGLEVHEPLRNAVAMRVHRRARAEGYHVQMYANDRFYVEDVNRYSDLYARLSGSQPVVVDSLERTFADRDSTKVVIVTDRERTPACEAMVREIVGSQAYVTRSNPEFVEVLDPHVDKGRALAAVASRLGIARERIVAIGDSYNDVPLLRAAGIGIAMGSAPQPLRDVAVAIVADVAHDGVVDAIERYVLRNVTSAT